MIRLHILALPHTITRPEFSHCAFTGKVLRFSPMMISRGFEVYHYGVETSLPNATKHFNVLSKEEWNTLRVQSLCDLNPDMTFDNARLHLENQTSFVGDLGNAGTVLYQKFNENLRKLIIENYRSMQTDIICLPFSYAHDVALDGLEVLAVETGIGYPNPCKDFRIYESYAVLHTSMAREEKQIQHYWFVAPNYYDLNEWKVVSRIEKKKIGFFGRLVDIKGLNIFIEIAKYFPNIEFIMCGQGDYQSFLKNAPDNLIYKPPIHGSERSDFLGSLNALIAPSMYVEPFCGVNVEAQLCGTPVITNEAGAFVETVEPFKTGIFCHTLDDFCFAVEYALNDRFDRNYIACRARKKYDMYEVAKTYEYILKNMINVTNGSNGWYAKENYMHLLQPENIT